MVNFMLIQDVQVLVPDSPIFDIAEGASFETSSSDDEYDEQSKEDYESRPRGRHSESRMSAGAGISWLTSLRGRYVGLRNLGGTCTLSTYMQFLYHVPHIRRVIYGIDFPDNANVNRYFFTELQKLFARLELSRWTPVDTSELACALGMERTSWYRQEDLHEFIRKALHRLQPVVDIAQFFRGEWIQELVSFDDERAP